MADNQNDPFAGNYENDPFVEDHFGGRSYQDHRVEQLPESTAILVLGILSLVGAFCYGIFGLILGIIAVAMASKPERLYRNEPGRYTSASYGNMRAGKICGIIGICLATAIILLVIIIVIADMN